MGGTMKPSVNLLPRPFQQQQRIRVICRGWIAIWAVTTLLALILVWRQSQSCADALNQRRQLDAEFAPVQKARQDTRQLRRRLDVLRRQTEVAWSLADQQPVLSLLGAVSIATASTGQQAAVLHLIYQNPESASESAKGGPQVTIQGYSRDHLGIAQFMSELTRLDLFDNVDLDSAASVSQPHATDGFQTYTIRCGYQQQGSGGL
jgi:hypothetical protein